MRLLSALFALTLTGSLVGTARPLEATPQSSFACLAVAQDKRPLSLAQIEQLIANHTPDEIIASEILERGVSFRIDKATIEALKSKGAGKKVLSLLEEKQKGLAGEAVATPEKIIVLVAEFTSLDGQKHGVSDLILDQLGDATKEYPEIEIQALKEPITAQQGSASARFKGKERGASIVLWGWYSSSKDKVLLSVHFEVVESPAALALMADKETLVRPIAELEGFQIQTRLSSEMTYLTLLTIGLARMEGMDFDGAIARFTKALVQPSVPDTMVNKTDVLFFRALSYFMKSILSLSGEESKVIEDLTEVIRLEPGRADAHLLRAGAYAMLDSWDKAIEDCNKVVEFQPDNSGAYMLRGSAYDQAHDRVRAAADFEKGARLTEAAISAGPQSPLAYYNQGNAYHLRGDEERALASLNKGLELNPQDAFLAMFLLQRAVVFSTLKRHDDALADLSRAIKLKDNYSVLYYARGGVFDDKGETDKAIADYTTAISLSPNLAEVYDDRGDAYWKKGEYQRAIEDFDHAILLKPKYSIAYYNRSFAKSDKGDLDGALLDLNKFIELEPADPDGFSQRGYIHRKKGNFADALRDYTRAIELAPLKPSLFLWRAGAYDSSGNLELAVADYSQAIKLAKDYRSVYVFRAQVYGRLGKTDLALNDYSEALKLKPDDVLAHWSRASLYQQSGNLTAAVDDYTASLKIQPDADNYISRGVCYQSLKKIDLALADYSEALRLKPTLAGGYLLRADLYEQQNQFDSAIADYGAYIGLKPEDVNGYFSRAKLYRRTSRFRDAVEDYTRAIKIKAKPELFLLRGFASENLGKLDSALDDYSEALRINPTSADAYLFRGLAYARKGDRDRAVNDLKKAIELTTNEEITGPAKRKLEELGIK